MTPPPCPLFADLAPRDRTAEKAAKRSRYAAQKAARSAFAEARRGVPRSAPAPAVGLSEAQRDRAAVVAAALAEWHRLAGEMENLGAFLAREGVEL